MVPAGSPWQRCELTRNYFRAQTLFADGIKLT